MIIPKIKERMHKKNRNTTIYALHSRRKGRQDGRKGGKEGRERKEGKKGTARFAQS
jgi:hypothetical protein